MAELSLCMIVRDESEVLARCLESVAGVADETVIVDTGSTDGTVEIARSFGARVERFAWIHDFSAARNRSFELASCPYILWLDADDVLLPAEREKLLGLKPRLAADAYLLRYDYAHDRFGACTTSFLRERIVRNTPRLRWCLPVHENIPLGPEVASAVVDVTVTHRPAGSMGRKHEKYLGILERLARQLEGSCPWVDCLLGSEYHAGSRYAEAVAAYERVLARCDERSIDGPCVRRQLAESHYGLALQARDPEEKRLHRRHARAEAESAWRLDPRRSEPLLLLGHIAEEEGDLAEAASWYERAIQPLPAVAAPVSPVAYGVAPAIRLSEVWKRLGDLPRARRYNEMALAWRPTDPLLHLARRALGSQGPLVVFLLTSAIEPWNGRTPDEVGVGGSETALARLAEELVRSGCWVVIFGPCQGLEGTLQGVEYREFTRFSDFAATHFLDVFVAFREASLLEASVRAGRRYLWVHDTTALSAESERGDLVRLHYDDLDAVVCVSRWQREVFAAFHGVPEDRIVVLPNAIDPRRFSRPVRRQQNRILYSSSVDRGLERVLDLFPDIRARIPDAELHVFYGFEGWNRAILNQALDGRLWAWRNSLKARLRQPGVVYHGRVGQRELALEMQRSEVWFYPTHFTETYCITALEAQMAGAVCVCSDLAALRTTVGDRGILIPGDPDSGEYRERALAEIFSLLEDRERLRKMRDRARRWARTQTWSRVAGEWVRMFREGI